MGGSAKIKHRRRRRACAGDWRMAVCERFPELAAAGYTPVRRKGREIFWHGPLLASTSILSTRTPGPADPGTRVPKDGRARG